MSTPAAMALSAMLGVYADVLNERMRQNQLWGKQDHDPFIWLTILGEEYGESCKAALQACHALSSKETQGTYRDKLSHLREELVQVAAVAVAAVESIDRGEFEWGKVNTLKEQ